MITLMTPFYQKESGSIVQGKEQSSLHFYGTLMNTFFLHFQKCSIQMLLFALQPHFIHMTHMYCLKNGVTT